MVGVFLGYAEGMEDGGLDEGDTHGDEGVCIWPCWQPIGFVDMRC